MKYITLVPIQNAGDQYNRQGKNEGEWWENIWFLWKKPHKTSAKVYKNQILTKLKIFILTQIGVFIVKIIDIQYIKTVFHSVS